MNTRSTMRTAALTAVCLISLCAVSPAQQRAVALSDTQIDAAHAITAGSFTVPGSANQISNLPPFCRVAGVITPTAESRIRFEVWMPLDKWKMVLDINLTGAFLFSQKAGREMLKRKSGNIINVASIAGLKGTMEHGQHILGYVAAKGGMMAMTRELAAKWARRGIRVNAIAPGFIETQMTAAMPIALREAGRRMNSMSQGGLPIDVAETIAWLAGPASSGVNGNVVRVCGQSLVGA